MSSTISNSVYVTNEQRQKMKKKNVYSVFLILFFFQFYCIMNLSHTFDDLRSKIE